MKQRIDIVGTIVADDEKWVYDWFGIDCVCPKNVKKALNNAAGEDVEIYINSGGGDVFAGSEIYSEIRAYPGNVKIHVTGLAASAASVIAMAGRSEMSPTAMIMIHNVSSVARGDYHAMDKESTTLKKVNEAVASAYIAKTGMSKEELLELMDKETWITADEAVKLGLVDEIATEKLKLVASIATVLPQEVVNKMREEKFNNTVNKPTNQNDESVFELQKLQTKLNILKERKF